MTLHALLQLVYMAGCLVLILFVFHLQRYRHHQAKGCLWWTYNLLAFAVGWELIDAWKYGPPGFPASRWFLLPSLLVIFGWPAIADAFGRRRK